MVEGVRVAATNDDCGLCVRMNREIRGRGRAAMVVRKGTGRFF